MERNGIIWQVREHVNSHPESEPIHSEADTFFGYAIDIIAARQLREDKPNISTFHKYLDELRERCKEYPLGRQLKKEENLPSGRRLTSYLSLLNEAVGIMPDYYNYNNQGVKKIGRFVLVLSEGGDDLETPRNVLSSGIDILTNGDVYVPLLTRHMYSDGKHFDHRDEARILMQLGFENFYLDQEKYEIPEKEQGRRTFTLSHQRLTRNQVVGLQSFMRERFEKS